MEQILVLRILYLCYKAYSCISDLILILQSIYLSYGSYTCVTDTEVPISTVEILLVQKYP